MQWAIRGLEVVFLFVCSSFFDTILRLRDTIVYFRIHPSSVRICPTKHAGLEVEIKISNSSPQSSKHAGGLKR